MNTSYFARYKGANGVSIALYPPKGFTGRQYAALAPPPTRLKWWKVGPKGSAEEKIYTDKYVANVLKHLDPHNVFEQIGEDAVLLCWEKRESFCHRHLVAGWLERALGITVEEL